MQRMSVDLPEPEGPQSTIFSPLRTSRLMFLSAWNPPYHFSTPSMTINGALGALAATALSSGTASLVMPAASTNRERDAIDARWELYRIELHPFLGYPRQLAVPLDLVDEGVDGGIDLLLAQPRAGAVEDAGEQDLVLVDAGL